ncbi:MAG: adenosylmethionine--8-amino-7-oxononanoate transaminase [Planctomycetia bacterium]|nr:adenosylmethionine--8-amino-7-oxononanoate transaminase [Planctomycetia bacterium]
MIWRPYTQMKTAHTPYHVYAAKGVYLQLDDRLVIDSIASWWAMIHGYRHPELTEAIVSQAQRFSHVMLGDLTHDPVEALAERLARWTPGDLNYCFFSDSGSVAVEVALKMALQFYWNQGQSHRDHVLSLRHAYHGDTFRAMEVGDDPDYHFIVKRTGSQSTVTHISTEIKELEEAFDALHERLNCVIVEPLLQCAGGLRTYDVSFLRRARELCDRYGVLLVFDEVATGFGRVGERLASDLVTPDIVALGKALTGGYIGHAVTIANERVFSAFYDDNSEHALMHGPTFMGNPLACAVALRSLEIFEREDYLGKVRRIEAIAKRELACFKDPRIREIRILGDCICLETYDAQTLKGYQQYALEHGVFARPFLNYLYAMPPYIITEEELVKVIDVMKGWFNR